MNHRPVTLSKTVAPPQVDVLPTMVCAPDTFDEFSWTPIWRSPVATAPGTMCIVWQCEPVQACEPVHIRARACRCCQAHRDMPATCSRVGVQSAGGLWCITGSQVQVLLPAQTPLYEQSSSTEQPAAWVNMRVTRDVPIADGSVTAVAKFLKSGRRSSIHVGASVGATGHRRLRWRLRCAPPPRSRRCAPPR